MITSAEVTNQRPNIEVIYRGPKILKDDKGTFEVDWVKIKMNGKEIEGLVLPSLIEPGAFVLSLGCKGSIPLPSSEQND